MADLNDPATERAPEQTPGPGQRAWAWLAGLLVIAVVAASLPPAAVPGLALTLVLALSFPSSRRKAGRAVQHLATVIAGLGCAVGLARFATSGAMLGIVESGQSAAAKSALYRLREVVIAEDVARRSPRVDVDGDGIGSAVLVGALLGAEPPRPGSKVVESLLNRAYRGLVETPLGPAVSVEGYLVVVCLPSPGGGFTARPGDPVDEELAERRFLAYAWPTEATPGLFIAFFADEHENIRVLELPKGAPAPYLGAGRPPACDAALGADHLPWAVWKNKQPRKKLPGDS